MPIYILKTPLQLLKNSNLPPNYKYLYLFCIWRLSEIRVCFFFFFFYLKLFFTAKISDFRISNQNIFKTSRNMRINNKKCYVNETVK